MQDVVGKNVCIPGGKIRIWCLLVVKVEKNSDPKKGKDDGNIC